MTTTIKSPERDGTWIVIRSNNAAHLEAQCVELENGAALVAVGRLQAALRAKANIGSILEAKPVEPQANNGAFNQAAFPAVPEPTPDLQPAQYSEPMPSVTQQPPGWGAAPNPQTPPAFGAPVNHRPTPAPATAPAAVDPWATPTQPSGAAGWGTGPADPWTPPAAAQPVASAQPVAGVPSGPPAAPGAPVVLGQPARMANGSSAKGPWHAWADPRPQSVTEAIENETDDPNHPGLAAGTHKYWAWIR
ncbi:hypothetical protein [Arthrobacter sp. 18067]|uniref:hypothetical protein n=1 Tax=Arthrobacter sp. 18067 TaxID=2681413 RepID=UPI00135A489C|nr:hypothetical protein [Arthrobacter sp. 18067]